MTNDLWKLGSRLYARVTDGMNKFLFNLFMEDQSNILRFSESALNKEICYRLYGHVVREKFFSMAIRLDGRVIKYMDLNEEKVHCFYLIMIKIL